jgi:hypothetical protein
MSFKSLGSFLTVLAFAGFVLFCSVMLMGLCPNLMTICSGTLTLPSTSILQITIAFLAVFFLQTHDELKFSSFTKIQFPYVPTFHKHSSNPPLFLLNEVYRL